MSTTTTDTAAPSAERRAECLELLAAIAMLVDCPVSGDTAAPSTSGQTPAAVGGAAPIRGVPVSAVLDATAAGVDPTAIVAALRATNLGNDVAPTLPGSR